MTPEGNLQGGSGSDATDAEATPVGAAATDLDSDEQRSRIADLPASGKLAVLHDYLQHPPACRQHLDVEEHLHAQEVAFSGRRRLRGLLWPAQDRDVLRPRLALNEHRRIRVGGGRLHSLVQRGSDQEFTGPSQSRPAPSAPGHRRITSPSFCPHPRWVSF